MSGFILDTNIIIDFQSAEILSYLNYNLFFVSNVVYTEEISKQIKSDSYCYELREGSLTKKENSYEFESTTSEKFSLLINPIIDKFNLGAQSVRNLRIWQVLFTERVINAIMRIPTLSERLDKFNVIDFSIYRQFKEPISIKEYAIVFLLKNRFFRVYDLLMHKQ